MWEYLSSENPMNLPIPLAIEKMEDKVKYTYKDGTVAYFIFPHSALTLKDIRRMKMIVEMIL